MRRLQGEAFYDSAEEIWLDDEHSIYPTFHILDGFVDDETGWIRLFATFQDFTSEEEDRYFCVIYINFWQSDNENYTNPEDIETVEDALNVEWIFPVYDVYTPQEKKQFLDLLDEYIEESEQRGSSTPQKEV
ncbi:MAG: hypothetical protein ACP5HC_06455 [Caldisericum sp.]